MQWHRYLRPPTPPTCTHRHTCILSEDTSEGKVCLSLWSKSPPSPFPSMAYPITLNTSAACHCCCTHCPCWLRTMRSPQLILPCSRWLLGEPGLAGDSSSDRQVPPASLGPHGYALSAQAQVQGRKPIHHCCLQPIQDPCAAQLEWGRRRSVASLLPPPLHRSWEQWGQWQRWGEERRYEKWDASQSIEGKWG